MMPWEHAIIGYIAYSLFVRAVYRESPGAGETLVVVFASVLPDLVDKPLAWEFGVFQSGYAIGHSIFVAVPVSILVGAIVYRLGAPRIGWAFVIGYLAHLPADVFPMYLWLGHYPFSRVLWPVRIAGPPPGDGLQDGFVVAVGNYLQLFTETPQSPYAMFVMGLSVFVVVLWVADGMPVARELTVRLRAEG